MATQAKPPVDLATLQTADDTTFWELAAKCGYERPAEIDPDQAWFWTRRWVTMEIEADWDYAEGRYTTYYSDEEFLASFEEYHSSQCRPLPKKPAFVTTTRVCHRVKKRPSVRQLGSS